MRVLFYLFFAGLICSALPSYGVKDPIKYGSVSMEELKMTVYEHDTSAPAVILCDYGCFDPRDFSFTRIIRIKILKKSGYAWGSQVFPVAENAVVDGITFNLENGKIVESKLESGSVYKEKIYGHMTRLRIAMPDVKTGSVIDIKFVYNGIPYIWKFQQQIPVRYSELILPNSSVVSFRKNFLGFEPLKLNEDGHWIAENMPAFKAEPYISSPNNYLTSLELDYLQFRSGINFLQVTTTWEELCQLLSKFNDFGIPLVNDSYMNQVGKGIKAMGETDKDKLKMAHDYIKRNKWNEWESLYTSESNLKWALEKKSGNSADINLALIQLLDKIGFQVAPVLMSSRDNGFLSPVNPSLNRLNYVIAKVTLNGEQILMDATEEYAPYDLLPERALNIFGRLYNFDLSEPVELSTNKKEKELVVYNLTLNDDLQLNGTLNFRRQDYAALDFRKKYKSYPGQEAYLEGFLTEFPGLRVRNARIENVDDCYMPVTDNYEITLNNEIEEINGNLYVFPMLLHRLKENPFKIDVRKYPVDFIHKIEKTYTVTINLPENYEVVSVPKNLKMMLPDNDASILYEVTVLNRTIQFNFKFSINKIIFTEDKYKDLREFYNQIIAKHAEPVIIKKKQN